MSKQHPGLTPELQGFVRAQSMFFVATSAPGARINLSPKGLDALRVIHPHQVVWMNLTGSGNETAAHLLEDSRMTLMFCSFAGEPCILRLFGKARALHQRDAEYATWAGLFPNYPGQRQMVVMDLELVTTSCGEAVPMYQYQGQRDGLLQWAEGEGPEGIAEFWQSSNRLSLDGRPTKILKD